MYARVLQKLLQEFFLSKGRGPMNAFEWSKLRKQAMELAAEGGKDPITGTKIRSAIKPLASSKMDLPGIASLKQRSNIIPFPKQQKRGDYQKAMAGAMKPTLFKKGLETLKGKMPEMDKQSWIKQKIQQNKDAIQRFKDKFTKKDKKTVEDFRDDGDLDPGGMAEGGIAPLVGEPTYAADFYDDREPFFYGGRINFSGGGRAGLPAVTISTPSAMGPQMPNAAPQPQGIPGAQMQMNMMDLNQNKMMQTPYMPTGGQPYKGQLRKTFAGGGETQSSPQEIFVKVMNEDYTPTPEEKEILAEYLKTESKADGGRMGFSGGGMGRRAFLKILGMLGIGAAGAKTGLMGLKTTKMAPKIAETITTTGASTSMPPWFPSFVEKVLKKGDDISDTAATQERVIAAQTKLPNSKTDVYVEHDIVTGDTTVDIGMGKHGWGAGFHGQPVRMTLKKGEEITEGKNAGTREADEFTVEEAEFTGGHPENVKFEESSYQNYGEHGSDFTELEEFATGQKAKDSKTGKQVWEADWDDSLPDDPEDFASGGIARMLGE